MSQKIRVYTRRAETKKLLRFTRNPKRPMSSSLIKMDIVSNFFFLEIPLEESQFKVQRSFFRPQKYVSRK